MPRIRTFLFDLGNVLLHFSHERMWRQLAGLCGREVADLQALIDQHGLATEFECGRLTEDEFHRRLQQLTEVQFERTEFRTALADIFELNAPMPGLLDRLRAAGYRLVLLSNTNETHLDWVAEHFHVLEPFDELVLSFRVGAMKPDGAMYEAALGAIGCPPDECFYTDDLAANIDKGREFGLQAEVFTDAAGLVGQLAQRGVQV